MHIKTHPTFAYTHPTSHTNTLNHYHFILKQIKKLKTKLTPITKFQLSSNKNINKNIKPNNKSHEDVQMNECNYVTSSFQCKKIHGIPYYTTINEIT